MNSIRYAIQLAEKSLEETEKLKKYYDNSEFAKYFQTIKKELSSNNPLDILKIPNYRLFLLIIVATEENKYLFSKYQEELNELESAVNSWQLDIHGQDLIELYHHTTDEGNLEDFKYMTNFTNLHLNLLSINYNLKLVYIVMYEFLKLKESLKKAEESLNTPNDLFKSIPKKNERLIRQKKLDNLRTIYEKSYLKTFIDALDKELTKENKENKENLSNIAKRRKYTLEVINHNDLSFITNIPDNWHRYLDPELLEELYNIVQLNLTKEYRSLQSNEQVITAKINHSKLTSFLYSKGYNPYSLDKNLLAKLEENDDIISSIEELLKYGLNINEIFTNYVPVLITLSKKQINTIRELLVKHALSPETLKNKVGEIFGPKYNEILTNVSILEPVIDFTNIFYDDQILFTSPTEIKNILSNLAYYNLTKNNYIFLLCHYKYLRIYDLLLENSISIELFISICKTVNPLSTIKRIMLYQNLSELYENETHRLRRDVLTEERFICSEEELDTLVPNVVPLVLKESFNTGAVVTNTPKHPIVKLLDKYYRIDDLYIIGNATISRSKFIRYFQTTDKTPSTIIPSLINSSILDSSQYYSLYDEINKTLIPKLR